MYFENLATILILLLEYNLLISDYCFNMELSARALCQGFGKLQPTGTPPPVLEIKFYWNPVMLICLFITYAAFMLQWQLRGGDRDHKSHLPLCRKSLLSSVSIFSHIKP